ARSVRWLRSRAPCWSLVSPCLSLPRRVRRVQRGYWPMLSGWSIGNRNGGIGKGGGLRGCAQQISDKEALFRERVTKGSYPTHLGAPKGGLFGHGHHRVGVIGRDDDGICLLRHQVIDHADLFVGIRDARSRVEKVDGHALPLQLGHCFFGAFLGRREVGRSSEFGDHEDHTLSSSQLGLLVGSGTQTTLRHQIASAGQKPHLEQIAPAESRLDKLSPICCVPSLPLALSHRGASW